MKRYSMEKRSIKPSIRSRFTNEEKYQIMYDYMVRKFPLEQIYERFRDRCSLQRFYIMPSEIYDYNKSVMNRLLQSIMSVEDYQSFKGNSAILGSKVSSYWNSEDEIFYKPITVNDLSEEELRLIN